MGKKKNVRDSLAFRSRGIIGILLLFPVGIAVIFSNPTILEGTFFDLLFDMLGWLCFGAYIYFRVWATIYVGGRKDSELQTEGPYSITRNPLYFGSLCFGLSAAFFLDSLSLAVTLVAVWFIYVRQVIKAEENVLENRFGKTFQEYCRRTPRLIPSPSLYHSSDSLNIKLKALRVEGHRLIGATLLPIGAEIIMHLRMASWWPHLFWLP